VKGYRWVGRYSDRPTDGWVGIVTGYRWVGRYIDRPTDGWVV
jgi:hypothetical protein